MAPGSENGDGAGAPSGQPTPWTEAMDGSPCSVELGGQPRPVARDDGDWGFIKFQCGPRSEGGSNGTTIEAMIDVLKERLEGFQRGPFACSENARAIVRLTDARHALSERTEKRQAQGVEGTNAAHV